MLSPNPQSPRFTHLCRRNQPAPVVRRDVGVDGYAVRRHLQAMHRVPRGMAGSMLWTAGSVGDGAQTDLQPVQPPALLSKSVQLRPPTLCVCCTHLPL